jgi:TPP-dependent pyruvate/acetoin dehydrogenase alpha subunit
VDHARSGQGPALVECVTFRVRGHSEADKADYVPAELRNEWLAKDPIQRFEAYLIQQDILTTRVRTEVETSIKEVVEDAVRFAEKSPPPDDATVAQYVYAPAGPIAIVGEPGAENPRYVNALDSRIGQPYDIVYKAEEAAGRR